MILQIGLLFLAEFFLYILVQLFQETVFLLAELGHLLFFIKEPLLVISLKTLLHFFSLIEKFTLFVSFDLITDPFVDFDFLVVNPLLSHVDGLHLHVVFKRKRVVVDADAVKHVRNLSAQPLDCACPFIVFLHHAVSNLVGDIYVAESESLKVA